MTRPQAPLHLTLMGIRPQGRVQVPVCLAADPSLSVPRTLLSTPSPAGPWRSAALNNLIITMNIVISDMISVIKRGSELLLL